MPYVPNRQNPVNLPRRALIRLQLLLPGGGRPVQLPGVVALPRGHPGEGGISDWEGG